MATTLPTLSRTIDNAFMTTWYEIRAEAIDNILNATVVWAALMAAGCMKTQVGSKFITRSIRYGTTDATEIARGDQLPVGENELETMAIWRWKYIASQVQRSFFDDQENNGPAKIKDLVGMKLKAARDGLEAKYETSVLGAIDTAETATRMQGLNDIIPLVGDRLTGTYGGITRPSAYSSSAAGVVATPSAGNTWWGAKYLAGTLANIEDDLIDDMKKMYNAVQYNQAAPNLILTDQTTFELYETFALDLSQIVKDSSGSQLADLGFDVLRFKGKPMVWTPNATANHLLFLNTDFIEVVYDPTIWFQMTDWKANPLETFRIAHIMCVANMISDQLRRHGRLYYA